jgi:ubiquinone biosynthesis protein UbiJ
MSKEKPPANLEPMQAWREWFLKNERDWSESLARMIKTDAVSKTLGKELNAMLYSQQALAKSMAGPMAMMNLPTRAEMTALSDRFGRLEDAVARIEAALVQMNSAAGKGAVQPPRTRKPARKTKKPARRDAE